MKTSHLKLGGMVLAALLSLTAVVPASPVSSTPTPGPDDLVTMCFNGSTNVQVRYRYVSLFQARGYTLGPCNVTPNVNN